MLRLPRILQIAYPLNVFTHGRRLGPYKKLPTLGGNVSSTRRSLVKHKHDEYRSRLRKCRQQKHLLTLPSSKQDELSWDDLLTHNNVGFWYNILCKVLDEKQGAVRL